MALAFEWSVGMQSMCSSPDNAIAGCRIARGHCRESHGGRCREMHGGHAQPAFRGRCETFRRPSKKAMATMMSSRVGKESRIDEL